MRRIVTSVLAAALLLVALPAFAGNGSNLLQYVPGNAQVVVGINVDALRGTPVWSQAMALAEGDEDLQSTLNTLQSTGGFNPLETVHTVVFASNEVSDDSGDHAVVLFEVDYPAESFATVLTEDNYVASTVGAITYYRKSESTVALLGENIIAVGEFALVEPAINVAAGQGSAGASGTVATQLGAVDKSGTIWIAAQLPAGAQGAQAARASINLSSGLAARIDVVMDNAETATEAANQFNAQIGAMAGSPEVAAFGLTSVLTGLQAAASGSEVSLSVTVDSATFSTLVGTLGEVAQEELR